MVLGVLALTALLSGAVAVTSSRTRDASQQPARTVSTVLNAADVTTLEQATCKRGLLKGAASTTTDGLHSGS